MAPGTSPHVPAWKKLGLKLKYARDEAPPPLVALGTNGTRDIKTNGSTTTEPPKKKRRFSDSDEPSFSPLPKPNGSEDPNLKKKVSFSSDTKTKDGDTARSANPPPTLVPHTNGTSSTTINEDQTAPQSDQPSKAKSKPKPKSKSKSASKSKPSPPSSTTKPKSKSKSASKSKPSPPSSTTKPKAGLSYLTTFYTTHSTWKFSKNHSTWLLKNALSESAVPKSFNFPLACYLHNLQSKSARERLKSECEKAQLAADDDDDDESGKASIDQNRIVDFISAIKIFTASPEDFKSTPAVAWAETQKRTDIVAWVLQPDRLHRSASSDETRKQEASVEPAKSKVVPTINASEVDGVPPVRRNRKSRTNITTADLSSSSSSSDTSSDEANDDGKADEDDTSSSGSDSDSTAESL